MPDPVYATSLANVLSDTPQLKSPVTHFTPASPQPSYPPPVSAPSRNRRGWYPTQLLSRFRSKSARDRPDTQQQPPPAPPSAPLLVDRYFRPLATPDPPPSLAAYNHLCQRVDKAAEIARTQMIVHVSVTAYGLATLATVRDIDFFARNEGSGVKVPLVDIEFPFGTYMMAIALLSTLTMFHFRICYGRTVRLSRSAEQLEALHRDDPAFVPARGDHRYPWFAFAVRERNGWSWIAAPLFHVVQYVLTPTLWALCCARTIRLGTNVQHWVSYQTPWHWPFTTVGALVALVCALLAVRDARSHGKRGWLTAATACLSLCVGVGWVGLSSWAGSDGERSPFNLKLRHAKLSSLSLANIELTYADLWEAHMEHAVLSLAQMEHADLRGAHIEHADLRGAHMEHADLRGAHMEHATLKEAHIEHATLQNAHMEHVLLQKAHMNHATLKEAHMEHATLQEAHIEHATLQEAHMDHAVLQQAHMDHAALLLAHMEHTNLRGAHMKHADLRGAHMEHADLSWAHMEHANLWGAHMEHADLSSAHMEHADLSSAHMEHTNFRGARMAHADLRVAHMEHAVLQGAHMEHVVLHGAHMEHAALQWAHMEHADLLGAHMEHAILSSAHMGHAALSSARMEHASLYSAHLEHAVLYSAHMEHTILSSARMEHADLRKAHIEHARLQGTYMEHADLQGAILHGSTLENAVFSSANLLATDVTQDQLDGKLTPPLKPLDFGFDPNQWAPPCGDAATQLPPLLVIAPCHPLVATW